MSETISPELARAAFRDHLRQKAHAAREKYGRRIDADTIRRMLQDGDVVRYPTTIEFEAGPLQANEFAFAQPLGFHSGDGFCLFVHPHFRSDPDALPLLVAYHIPVINYGDIVEAPEAELFGASLLGLEVEAYYEQLCALVDGIPARGGAGQPHATDDPPQARGGESREVG